MELIYGYVQINILIIIFWNGCQIFTELGILVSGMSTVMEETDGFTKQYSCDMAIYLTTVLSYLYGIII